MTEEGWLTERERPQWMIGQPIGSARSRAARRKLGLFAVGCCRLMWELMWDDRLRAGVEVAERFADGRATEEERIAALLAAKPLSWGEYYADTPENRKATVGRLAYECLNRKAGDAGFALTAMRVPLGGLALPDGRKGKALLCDLIREAFGNFINPAVAQKHWLTWNSGIIPRLAREIYDERAWDRMGVLADALEDAGCSDDSILSHLRGPGPHFRGCWVVDLLLGKSPRRGRAADAGQAGRTS